jgi:probable rRNA maturation factor
MIELDNRTSLEVNRDFLETVLSSQTPREIELLIVSNAEMQEINKTQREINKPTDVLSFPYDMPLGPLGSIVISCAFVQEGAQEFGHTTDDEMALLFIHGLLHILGYDHEVDNGEMRQKEKEIIEQFSLPKSLIVRTQG